MASDAPTRLEPDGPPEAETSGLPIPLGRRVSLPGRGTTFVREVAGPPGAPTVVLLHGLGASGGLNWFQAFGPLGAHFRVIAPDLRGHGRGIRAWRRFRLADCADDVSALLHELGVDQAIAVGYSMGGPVAQLLWRRHPEQVAGLVMCATGTRFVPGVRERLAFVTAVSAIAGSTRVGQLATRVPIAQLQRRMPAAVRNRPDTLRQWARAEMRRHDPRMVAEALAAVSSYNAERWLRDVDVPTTVMITTLDKAIPPGEQRRLLGAIPGASVHTYAEGHIFCARPSFGPALLKACREVHRRGRRRS
ncbi:MAG: putative hydrolase or acyltransferase of alpha/beta superfamily [Acidimicrobiales bacterium]|nr:putative hydrolase or acyltransferase of alpha/beta superfamily [Acidimicrobiales bacterium]